MYALIDKPVRKAGADWIVAGKNFKVVAGSPRDDFAMTTFGARFAI